MNTDWKTLLYRRLRAEALDLGIRRVDITSVRMMHTRPEKMFAVVIADGVMYAVTGCNENETAHRLRVSIERDRQSLPKEFLILNS
jgi:hypothetical protein